MSRSQAAMAAMEEAVSEAAVVKVSVSKLSGETVAEVEIFRGFWGRKNPRDISGVFEDERD